MMALLAAIAVLHIWVGTTLTWGSGPATAELAVWPWLAGGFLLLTAMLVREFN